MAEPRVERRLAAILAADVAGYSRLMGADEEGTLAALKTCRRELIDPKIAEHRGRVVKTTGDGALVEFASAVDAARCAVEIQRAMAERNAVIPEDRRVEFRIGINVGDIIIDERDIFGDGVNVAARLEGLAESGGICVSGRVHEDVQGKLDIAFEDAGERQLKNILRPITIDTARQAEKRKINPLAEDLLVRGIALADKPQTFENLIEQEQLFRQSLALDPDNAEAWARLGRSLLHQQINFAGFLSSQEAKKKLGDAQQAVEKAILLDANNPRARFAEALLYRVLRKPAESVRANEIAIALDRNFAAARNVLSSALLDMGQPEKAIPQTEQAMRLDPLGPQINTMQFNMGKAHFLLQHTEEALDWFLKSRASNPNFPRTLVWIAALYIQKGDESSAQQAVADLLRVAPHFRLSLSIDAPSSFSPEAHREYYDRVLLPLVRTAGVPE